MFEQKTAYDVLISDWSSDVCSSDLFGRAHILDTMPFPKPIRPAKGGDSALCGNSSAGQDNDVANVFHDRHEARTKGRFQDMTKIGIYGASGRMGQAIAQALAEIGRASGRERVCQ